jgi:hypothetical protein
MWMSQWFGTGSCIIQSAAGKFWVHPMKKNRMTDNVIFVSLGGALDNIKPDFTDIQE